MSAPASLLVVEDDVRLNTLISRYLRDEGFQVACVFDGASAVEHITRNPPDLVVLDWMLPEQDGLAVCRQVRPIYHRPILMLTAKSDDIDQVVGLEVGADDYVIKPVQPRVLLARIQALLRRSQPTAPCQQLQFGGLQINASSRQVQLDGQPVELSEAEFCLLYFFAQHAGEVLSRDVLFKGVMGLDYDGLDRSIDVKVAALRKHIERDHSRPSGIKTVRGKGYLFNPDGWA